MCICSFFIPGAGVGEGNTYQRVYVDDGSTTMGPLDYVVLETVSSSLHLCRASCHSSEGRKHALVVTIFRHLYTCIYKLCVVRTRIAMHANDCAPLTRLYIDVQQEKWI